MVNSRIQQGDFLDNVSADFGVDPEGPVPEEDAGTVVILETVLPLSEEDI